MKVFGRIFSVVLVAAVVGLSACGSGDNTESGPAVPAAEQYNWDAEAPSTVQAGPPATLNLGGGYAAAILANTAVIPGDAVTASYSINGPAGKYVRVILQRHCSIEAGDASVAEDVLMTGQPQQGEIAMTFAEAYDCIRVSFVANGHEPMAVTVDNLTVTKSPAGS